MPSYRVVGMTTTDHTVLLLEVQASGVRRALESAAKAWAYDPDTLVVSATLDEQTGPVTYRRPTVAATTTGKAAPASHFKPQPLTDPLAQPAAVHASTPAYLAAQRRPR